MYYNLAGKPIVNPQEALEKLAEEMTIHIEDVGVRAERIRSLLDDQHPCETLLDFLRTACSDLLKDIFPQTRDIIETEKCPRKECGHTRQPFLGSGAGSVEHLYSFFQAKCPKSCDSVKDLFLRELKNEMREECPDPFCPANVKVINRQVFQRAYFGFSVCIGIVHLQFMFLFKQD